MHIKGKYTWIKHIDFMIIDFLSMMISSVLAYVLKFKNFDFYYSDVWIDFFLIVLLLELVICLLTNPHSAIFRRSFYEDIYKEVKLAVYNFLAACVILYVFKVGAFYSRTMIIVMYLTYFVLALVFKYIWKKLIVGKKIRIFNTKPISLLVVGEKDNIEKVIHNASAGDFQLYDIKGVCMEDHDGNANIQQIPVVPSIDSLVEYVIANNIKEVLVATNPSFIKSSDYETLISNGIAIHMDIESIVGFQTEDQMIDRIGVYKTLSLGMYSFTSGQMIYLMVKRVIDILFGIAGIIFLIPVAILVKISCCVTGDRNSIFYTQKRVGKNGKIIRIFKFRTMVPNAQELLEEMLKEEHYRIEWEANQKFVNDPRITKVGKVMRKTSLDELPQFINVLLGEMSLVGPRPLVVGELEIHGGLKLYNQVKPGITGWWACNGRSDIDYRERLELEYYYVKNCSLHLDLLCIMRTILAVIKRKGAV